jgi:16S rRNA (guanine1207-N2)-methyltransferase
VGGGLMAHYFTKNQDVKSNPKVVSFHIDNVDIKIITDHGLFNKGNLDLGTKTLLKAVSFKAKSNVLDLGCGSGIVGIYAMKKADVTVDMVDVNERAVEIAKRNKELNHVEANIYVSNGFDNINKQFDIILSNPPIHAGKQVVYRLFKEASTHLTKHGSFYMVMHKKHGAKSAIAYLDKLFNHVTILKRNKGFYCVIAKNN